MATKKTTTPGTPATPRAPRTPKPVSAEAQALIDVANQQIVAAKSAVKEAKALGKVIGSVASLSEWGLAQLQKAVDERKAALAVVTEE